MAREVPLYYKGARRTVLRRGVPVRVVARNSPPPRIASVPTMFTRNT